MKRDIVQITKIVKLQEVKRKFNLACRKPRVLVDRLGIYIDGGRSNKDDFKELWEGMEESETAIIRDADNNFHTGITKDQVQEMYKAIVAFGRSLYGKKWQLEELIGQASSLEELDSIQW